MIATTHLAIGAAAGLWASRVVDEWVSADLPAGEAGSVLMKTAVQLGTAFVMGAISHFVLDAIPHSEAIHNSRYGERPVLAVELVIIFSIIFWICHERSLSFPVIFFGIVGGAWPDLFYMLNAWFPEGNRSVNLVNQFHSYCHASFELASIYSLPIQFLIAGVAILFLF